MAKKVATYASVLAQTLGRTPEQEQREVAARFKRLLKKRGDLKLLSAVLLEFRKLWDSRKGTVARMVTAQETSAQEPVRKALEQEGYQVREERDENLVGGVAVFLGNEALVDNSVRGRLRRLQSLLGK